ncbi:hypothetical protein [Dyella sp.]|uniref:hypothetical protein n=1 Tax=Dyella sp. TaxID=1869338 RepID=UPI002B46A1C1|nr:hypothetical protein [Dyella sp.]HKT30574.1 hypothetical protein [Dyella sp.]
MHLELPNAPLRSLKDFLKHYLMIVLSILTALGLEAWIEHTNHRHAAEVASAQIDTEIRANLAEVHTALVEDKERATSFAHIRDSLEQDLKANTPDATIVQHILAQTQNSNFNLNLRWPTLRQEAWDVAVANQSVSWMDDDRMYRYSAAYATQRETAGNLAANLTLVMNGPRMIDAATDLRSGNVQPREFLHVIAQMAVTLDQATLSLRTLEQKLQSALPEPPHKA